MDVRELSKALQILIPNCEWKLVGDSYDDIEWLSEGAAPAKKDVLAKMEEIKKLELAEIENKANAKAALLARLGMTADEAALLLS